MTFSVGNQEDSLLRPDTLNLIVLNDELLLENFDGIEFASFLRLGQHDLTEVTLAKNSQEVEVVQSDALAGSRVCRKGQRFAGGHRHTRSRRLR